MVTFQPDGQTLEVPVGATLLAAVLRVGRPIGYACRGRGVCVACRLRVEGPLSPIEADERTLLDQLTTPAPAPDEPEGHPSGYRIACLARILGDVRVRADYW